MVHFNKNGQGNSGILLVLTEVRFWSEFLAFYLSSFQSASQILV